jgi:hypothetical protein
MTQSSTLYESLARRARQRHVRKLRFWAVQAGRAPAAWQTVLDAEIERLPEESRTAVVTCYLEDRPPREAAALLGWSRRKVCTQLLLGRRRLLRRLEQQGLALSARSLRRVLREDARSGGMSDATRTQAVLLATSGAATVAWSSRLAELVRVALKTVDQWMAE